MLLLGLCFFAIVSASIVAGVKAVGYLPWNWLTTLQMAATVVVVIGNVTECEECICWDVLCTVLGLICMTLETLLSDFYVYSMYVLRVFFLSLSTFAQIVMLTNDVLKTTKYLPK